MKLFGLRAKPIFRWASLIEFVVATSRPLMAIALAFLVTGVFIFIVGADPYKAYGALIDGAVGSLGSLTNTGVRATPLLLGGLGVALGFKAGLLNVGVEGQIYIGGIFATAIGILPLPLPAWLHLIFSLLAGFIGGALWIIVPAFLKAYRGISEIVLTLMMNYVGIYLASYFVHGPLAEEGAFYPQSPPIQESARLPLLIQGTSLHAGLIVGLFMALMVYFILWYLPFGFKTRMIGANPLAAQYAGVKVPRQIFIVLLLCGGFGGLAGTGEILGLKHRFFDFFSSGLGYDAIAVALLANSNPLGVVLSALFFGALKAGANKMQQVVGIETSLATVIQALSVLFVIGIGFASQQRTNGRHNRNK